MLNRELRVDAVDDTGGTKQAASKNRGAGAGERRYTMPNAVLTGRKKAIAVGRATAESKAHTLACRKRRESFHAFLEPRQLQSFSGPRISIFP